MSYNIQATPQFASDAKKLSKKYPSLKNDLASLASQLSKNPIGGPLLEKTRIYLSHL